MATASNRIVIIGAGPVGLAFALAVARLRGLEVTLIERRALSTNQLMEGFDQRVYALSPGSRALLQELGVWQLLDSTRIAPIRAMQVFGDAGDEQAGEIDFSQGSPLAFVVEHAALMNAMQAAVSVQCDRIQIIDNAEVAAIDFAYPAGGVEIRLADQATIVEAALLVAADGSASRVRGMAGIDTQVKDYGSDGVVANFRAARGHGSVARQWFSAQGVLAYLPLPGDRVSIVWSVPTGRAAELEALDAGAFSAAVAAAGNNALGELALTSPRVRIPLKRMTAAQWVQPGLALIGDAAHSIHPLAGQGANLGFADIAVLFAVLRDRSPLSSPGDVAILRRYERARREDAWAMGEITDNLRSLYLGDGALAKIVRRDGLNMVNRLSATKAMLIAHAIK